MGMGRCQPLEGWGEGAGAKISLDLSRYKGRGLPDALGLNVCNHHNYTSICIDLHKCHYLKAQLLSFGLGEGESLDCASYASHLSSCREAVCPPLCPPVSPVLPPAPSCVLLSPPASVTFSSFQPLCPPQG